MLFGRRTYEDFYGFWPNQTGNPFSERLAAAQKYVASRTLAEPLPWINSTLLKGDAAEAVAELKSQPGGNIAVFGSGDLTQTLMRHDLVDTYVLMIHPVVLGAGRRLFPEGTPHTALTLVDSVASDTGVLIATYRPAR